MLFNQAVEYAQIYLLAKHRHKGCEGTGVILALKEEFRDVIDKVIILSGKEVHFCRHII
jgi:hypothetical protein